MASEKLTFIEPKKYNPSDPESKRKEEIDNWTKMVSNQYTNAVASYRDSLALKEQFFPSFGLQGETSGATKYDGMNLDRGYYEADTISRTTTGGGMDSNGYVFAYPPTRGAGGGIGQHRRNESVPIQNRVDPFGYEKEAVRSNHLTKSLSDSNFYPGHATTVTQEGSPRRRKKIPEAISTLHSSPSKMKLESINEQDVSNYKVVVKTGQGEDSKVSVSPVKKLFGEGGFLGRSTSAKDLPDPRYKKSTLASWSGKLKEHVETLGREISGKLPPLDPNQRRPTEPPGPSTFPISIPPLHQGELYMKLELLLSSEINRYMMSQQANMTVESVRKVFEKWTNKGRPQVIEFRYDLSTQHDLISYNMDTMRFHGIASISRAQIISILGTWKILAKEISVRTFCQPDSAIKKHLHDAEIILELIDANLESIQTLQDMRSQIIWDMRCVREAQEERAKTLGVERAWSPSRFRSTWGDIH